MRRHRLAENTDASRGRRDQPEDHVNRRGLAGPRSARAIPIISPRSIPKLTSSTAAKFPNVLLKFSTSTSIESPAFYARCAVSSSGKNKTAHGVYCTRGPSGSVPIMQLSQ